MYRNYIKDKEDKLNRSLTQAQQPLIEKSQKMMTVATKLNSKPSPAEIKHHSRPTSKAKPHSKQSNSKTIKAKDKISDRLERLEKVTSLFSYTKKYKCNIELILIALYTNAFY